MGDLLGRIGGYVADLITTLGYPGLALLAAVENLVPPIPGELILPFSGFLASQGRFSLLGVIAASTIGSVAGAFVVYLIGLRLGEERLAGIVERYGRYVRLGKRDLKRADDWFDRHGRTAVLFAHFIPGIRSFISLAAGMRRFSVPWFLASTAIGAGIWNAVLATAGSLLGAQWERIKEYAELFGWAALALVVVAVAFFVWRRRAAATDGGRGR